MAEQHGEGANHLHTFDFHELAHVFGPGYRIYFGRIDNTIVLLFCGGDKSTQARDIRRAKTYWLEHKEERQ